MSANFSWLIDRAEELNDAIIPGPGKLFGLNPKHDFFSPVDVIPVVGPLNKLNKGRKLATGGLKWLVLGVGTLTLEVLAWREIFDSMRFRKGEVVHPPSASPKRTTVSTSGSRSGTSKCPPGMRWDYKKRSCVRIRKR